MNSAAYARIILVVHDVEESRDGLEKLLLVDGYRVDCARREDEAVAKALLQRPHLILVNLGGRPTEVIASGRGIRHSARLGHKVPVVIFCVDAVDEGEERDIGDNVHVICPNNFEQLRAFIRLLLRQHPA